MQAYLREMQQQAVEQHKRGNLQAAAGVYDNMLGYNHNDPWIALAYGTCLGQMGMHGAGTVILANGLAAVTPEHEARMPRIKIDLYHNLGLNYRALGVLDKAIECYQHELKHPNMQAAEDFKNCYINYSGCFVNEGQPEEAEKLANIGLRYGDAPQLHNHKALALLEQQKYKDGFAEYEHRYTLPEFHRRDYGSAPYWDGKMTTHLAIHGEQGLGDEILFLSNLIPLLEEFPGMDVDVECAARLLSLLKRSFAKYPRVRFYPNHQQLIAGAKSRGEITGWCGMGSLFHLMGRCDPVIPAGKFLEGRAVLRAKEHSPPRIGLSWRGGTLKTHEYYRNAPLDLWKRLVDDLKGNELVSLQYGPVKEMAEQLGIPHEPEKIEDLDTLTGMVENCDLVISVCNTTIHQAGATGTPCIVLVPSKPAWRYGIRGDRSDWYKSVQYVRQEWDEGERMDWSGTFERLRKQLKDMGYIRSGS